MRRGEPTDEPLCALHINTIIIRNAMDKLCDPDRPVEKLMWVQHEMTAPQVDQEEVLHKILILALQSSGSNY